MCIRASIKEVVPEYLMLLKGVIDCPDLPLNVSRSFLQNDGDVQKISRHITKKVSDKLHSVFEEDRASFEGYWEDIAPFIKFGCIKDEKFYDRVKDIVLFKTLNHDYRTLEAVSYTHLDVYKRQPIAIAAPMAAKFPPPLGLSKLSAMEMEAYFPTSCTKL